MGAVVRFCDEPEYGSQIWGARRGVGVQAHGDDAVSAGDMCLEVPASGSRYAGGAEEELPAVVLLDLSTVADLDHVPVLDGPRFRFGHLCRGIGGESVLSTWRDVRRRAIEVGQHHVELLDLLEVRG